MRSALACLLLIGLGLACAACRMPTGPAPRMVAQVETPSTPVLWVTTVLADAPKTSPPVLG